MKWILISLFSVVVIGILWRVGFLEEFLGPWDAWMSWIGYFGK